MINSTGASSIAVNNDARVESSQTFWKDYPIVENSLRLKTSGGLFEGDETFIAFNPQATNNVP